jgi:aminopeptidase N
MTYSKAPEFVRMVELTIGADAFSKGLDAYHTKFKYEHHSKTV